MAARRALSFVRLDDIMPEVERLQAGHDVVGSWSLGQILHHLAVSVRLSALGRPASNPRPSREAEVARRLFFRAGRFPDGVEAPLEVLRPPADADALVEAESLRSALDWFARREGPFPAHPSLGPMSRDEWAAFHRIHCAHHLGFARPTGSPDGGGPP